eukprot:TRINITY_DN33675_c0_g1_i1.p1 TRINITY_DN33675_c0_g1~~TRINITY_DN33675_c0_g1_i1.p1  ORF type:complete len:1150 (-),score=206.19 TRINITY_DN33675_c0_g1_i1:164-3613(-)
MGIFDQCDGFAVCSMRTCISTQQSAAFNPCEAGLEVVKKAVKTSALCGGDPVELAKRNVSKAVEANVKKVKQSNAKTSTSLACQERVVFVPQLPRLEDSYSLVDGVQHGILKQAIHRESRQKRAILAIPKNKVPPGITDDVSKEVRQRLETLLRIDHVNILALHEACEDMKFIYLVYDWPDGGLLVGFLAGACEVVTEAHISSVAREVLSAIAAANRFSVHHLDWSLLCIFLGYKNRFSPVKVLGFGLAGVIVPLVTTRLRSRTVSRSNKHFYAAPELLFDHFRTMPQHKLHNCDVWSVGTLIYMLFSGRPPFYGQADEVVDRIKRGHFSFGYEFDTISREAKDGIEKMLTRKWEIRPPASDLLKHPFMQLQITGRRKEGIICQDALTKLNDFAQETHCKQTLARLLADLGLQESQYSDLEERFKQLDLDGNGVIEVSELCEVAQSLPEGKDSEAIAKTITEIIKHCDRNDNSTVDISEFVAAVVLKLEQKDERLLVKAFDKMDMNGDARITKGELFRVLRQYSDSLIPGDVATFVKEMDDDNDQKIDYVEFKDLFRNTKDRDEEVKKKVREVRAHADEMQRVFETMQIEAEKFFVALKTNACLLAMEYDKMKKPNAGYEVENAIAEKVKTLLGVVKSFAGRMGKDDESKIKGESDKRERNTLTGLAVMNRYNRDGLGSIKLEDIANRPEGSLEGSPVTTNRDPQSGGSDSERRQKRASTWIQAGGAEMSAGQMEQNCELTIAEEYTLRGNKLSAGKTATEIKSEANRRRRYLWLGGGDGVAKLRSHFLGKDEGLGRVMMTQRRRTLRIAQKKMGERMQEDPGQATESSADDDESDIESARALQQKAGKKFGMFSNGDSDDEQNNQHMMPWTPTKKLKGGGAHRWSKECMFLCQGPSLKMIGAIEPEAVPSRLQELAKGFLEEYSLHPEVTKDLCDLRKLLRYKCARTWLPPLSLWVSELKASLDQQRVHIVQRKNIHMACIKHVLQICERIMFSLSEFLIWQEEGFYASWSTENISRQPPVSKRFLPYRGDVDELARTPRDDDDALALAPEEAEQDPVPTGDDDVRDVIFAESAVGLNGVTDGDLVANDYGVSVTMGSALLPGGQKKKKLDRTFVRARNSKDPRAAEKLQSLALEGAKQAATMQSMLL